MLTLTFRSGLITAAGTLTAAAAVCAVLRIREGKPGRHTLALTPFFSCFFAVCGALMCIPYCIADNPACCFLVFVGIICLCSAMISANQRIIWDDNGFFYRTILRRTVRYGYEDIRRIKPVFASSPVPADLYLRVAHKRLLIDGFTSWQGFAGAYENWQTRSGRISWKEEIRQRFEARYRRHGPFRRKLDRIPGGYCSLVFYTFGGLMFLAFGVMSIVIFKDAREMIMALFMLFLSGLGFRYWYAVAHLDDKPKLIRKYISRYVRIRPDPDAPPKVYRRRKLSTKSLNTN